MPRSFRKSPQPVRRFVGFSLLEVLLAMTVLLVAGTWQLGQLRRDTEAKQAMIIGQQLRSVGYAFNAYITEHSGQITNMTSVDGVGNAEDPGPRACNNSTKTCTVTSDTLRRAGVLPNSFSGRNSYGSTYNYYIRVTGSEGAWNVDGIVVTNDPYTSGGSVRHDLIGTAMMEAGADSGTTRTVANQINGYNGTWLETGFPAVNQIGLIAFRAGYGATNNSAYLRKDGSVAMTGDLQMGGHDIRNIRDVDGRGTTYGNQFRTDNQSTEAIVLGAGRRARFNNEADPGTIDNNRTKIGNSASTPGRLAIDNTGGLELLNTAGGNADLYAGNISGSGFLNIQGNGVVQGTLTAGSFTSQGNAQVNGTLYAQGAITSDTSVNVRGSNGNVVLSDGNINADRTISSRDLTVTASATIGNGLTVGGDAQIMGDLRMGAAGWRYDSASNTMQALSNANISGNNIVANGYLQTLGTGTVGAGCTARGEIRTDNSTGQLIVCNGSRYITTTFATYSTKGAAGNPSIASCAANERVTGCSADYISRTTIDHPSSASNTNVVGNTCQASAPSGVTIQAVAVCAR